MPALCRASDVAVSALFARPMGDVSRRLHGVIRQLRARQATASDKAREAEAAGQIEFAASLRGKARGYSEAIDLLVTLDRGRPLRRRSRWSRTPEAPSPTTCTDPRCEHGGTSALYCPSTTETA